MLLRVIITNEVPVTILQVYILIRRHIRKGVLIRLIIASHLCTADGGQQFRKEWRKLQTRIMFERYYSFFQYCLLFYRYVMFQKRILCKPKWGGGHKQSLWGAQPPGPPVATALISSNKDPKLNKNCYIVDGEVLFLRQLSTDCFTYYCVQIDFFSAFYWKKNLLC